jgi:SPP1 family phage portal protein
MGLIDGMTIEDDNLKNPKKEYKNFLRKFTSLLKGASNKGVEWINVYRDKTEGAPIRWAVVDARQCIPIWETVYQEKLSGMIRYYSVSTTIASDESQDLITAEWWDDKNVRRFQQQSDGSYLLLSTEPHWQVVFSGNAEPQPNSLGTVPWIPVANNDEYITDLEAIKSLIDDYDLLTSDRSNTLTDLQDAILAVKGYEGDSEVELRLKIKHNKIIRLSTDSEADAKAITYEPPSQAHTEHLDREERDIHLFGRGVKMRSDEAGGNPSGVALKMMTTWLLLKCSAAEAGLSIAFSQLVWFITEYLKEKGISYDPSAISIKFNQALILNESEVIDNCVNSKGVSDLETIVSHHPWNVDPKTVLDNLKNETLELAAIDNAVGTQKIDKMGLSGEGK